MRRRERELEAENKRLRDASLAPPQPKAEPTKLDEARAAPPKPVDDPEPDRTADPEAWRDWKIRDNDRWRATVEAERQAEARQRQVNEAVRGAIEEFQSIETAYVQTNPDYFNATQFGRQKYTEAMRVMHPEMNDRQIAQHIDYEIMKQASDWRRKGLNPAEEFYDYCIERLGYKPTAAEAEAAAKAEAEAPAEPEKPAAPEPEDDLEALANLHRGLPAAEEPKPPPARPKPSLKQIAAARRRSASPLQGPGQGGRASVTKEAAAEMTLGDFAELSPADLADLEAMEE
jgi:hypothetical protein